MQLIASVFPDLMRGVGFPPKFTGKAWDLGRISP